MNVNTIQDIKIQKKSAKKFWIRLEILFKNKDGWLNDLYITDICKCTADKNPKLLSTCGLRHSIQELLLINPKFAISQGNDSCDYITPVIQGLPDMSIHFSNLLDEKIESFYKKEKMGTGVIML